MKVNARCIARQRLFSLRFQQHSIFNCCTLKRGYFRSTLPILCSTQDHSQKTDVKLLPLSVVAQNSSPLPCLFWNTVLQSGDCLRFSLCVFRSMLHLSCNFIYNSKRRLLSNQTEVFFASYPKQSSGFKTNKLLRNTKQALMKSKITSFHEQNNLRFFYI